MVASESWRAKLLQENILFLFMRIIRVIKRKMISTLRNLRGLPLLPGRLVIFVLPFFCMGVDILNKPVELLRKPLQIPCKIRIPLLRLPVIPALLASGAVRKVVFHNHGALTLPAMEGFPRLLTGVAAVLREEVVRRLRRGTLLDRTLA